MYQNTKVIGEIASHHMGSRTDLLDLINAGSEFLNAIKFQLIIADELHHKSEARWQEFKSLEFNIDTWKHVINHCNLLNLDVWCDIFGANSLKLAQTLGVRKIKLQSGDLNNNKLLEQIDPHKFDKVHLSLGFNSLVDLEYQIIRLQRARLNVGVVVGTQRFPGALEDINPLLVKQVIRKYKDNGVEISVADHLPPNTDQALMVPEFFASWGVDYIEKHYTIYNDPTRHDYESAVSIHQLQKLRNRIDFVNHFINTDDVCEAEKIEHKKWSSKQYFATTSLKENHTISDKDVNFVRSESLSLTDGFEVRNRTIRKEINAGQIINPTDILPKIVSLVYARTTSNRLKDKALLEISNKPVIQHVLETADRFGFPVVFATSDDQSDDKLANFVESLGYDVRRGSLTNIALRLSEALEDYDCDYALRFTGDSIFVFPDELKKATIPCGLDYITISTSYIGGHLELIAPKSLKYIANHAVNEVQTEYLTWFLEKPPFRRKHIGNVDQAPLPISLMVDEREDYQNIQNLLSYLPNWHEYTEKQFCQKVVDLRLKFLHGRPIDTSIKKPQNFDLLYKYQSNNNFLGEH